MPTLIICPACKHEFAPKMPSPNLWKKNMKKNLIMTAKIIKTIFRSAKNVGRSTKRI